MEAHVIHEIPKVVYYQALNFFLLLALLHFLLRNKVKAFFLKRHNELKSAVNEARQLRESAEKKQQEYTLKLQNLEKDLAQTIDQIKKEGEAAKQKIIQDAKKMAENIESEAMKSIQMEIEKAKKKLYEESLDHALSGAKNILEKEVEKNDQHRLQQEFLTKVESLK